MTSAAFITSLIEEQPDLTEHLLALQDLHTRRLWHQLTVKLEACFQIAQFNQGDLPARIFQSFVLDFAHKINILKLAHFAVGCICFMNIFQLCAHFFIEYEFLWAHR